MAFKNSEATGQKVQIILDNRLMKEIETRIFSDGGSKKYINSILIPQLVEKGWAEWKKENKTEK